MAPPLQPFPVSELEDRVHITSKKFKEKSRKLPKDFDLQKDCELFELVQYSCTTEQQTYEQRKKNINAIVHKECFPFVRLFRRCGQGEKMFHVETTAWEGEYAWKPPRKSQDAGNMESTGKAGLAKYASALWSMK